MALVTVRVMKKSDEALKLEHQETKDARWFPRSTVDAAYLPDDDDIVEGVTVLDVDIKRWKLRDVEWAEADD